MLKDLIARIESNPNLESSILRALEGIAFEFATAGTDAGRLGAFQEELGANFNRLVKAIINVPVREPKATPIEQTPLAQPTINDKEAFAREIERQTRFGAVDCGVAQGKKGPLVS